MLGTSFDNLGEFRAPQTMTPSELGDNLARLVWESFSDFVAHEEVEAPPSKSSTPEVAEASPDERTAEEALIFFLWAHTRGAQQAFLGRAPDAAIRAGLDALHKAVFEDMVQHGTPASQLPIFEQRVSARYAEYHQAAAESDDRLGEAVSRHLAAEPAGNTAQSLTERAIAVANPLKDFLEDVELLTN